MMTYEEYRNPFESAVEVIAELKASLMEPQGGLNTTITNAKKIFVKDQKQKKTPLNEETIKVALTDINIMKALSDLCLQPRTAPKDYEPKVANQLRNLYNYPTKFKKQNIDLTCFASIRERNLQIALENLIIEYLIRKGANPLNIHYIRKDIREGNLLEIVFTGRNSARKIAEEVFNQAEKLTESKEHLRR